MRRAGAWLTVALLALAVTTACHKKKPNDELPSVRGSGVGSSTSRQLAPFSRIDVGGALEVTVNVGKNEPLEIRGEDNLFEHIASTVVGGELALEPDAVLKTTQPLRLVVGTERLEAVTAAVSAKVTVHGVKTDAFTLRAGGAARVLIDGSARTLSASARSIAQLDLRAFQVGNAVAVVLDFAHADFGYVEKLDATQKGHGIIGYRGTPDLSSHAERPSNVAPER